MPWTIIYRCSIEWVMDMSPWCIVLVASISDTYVIVIMLSLSICINQYRSIFFNGISVSGSEVNSEWVLLSLIYCSSVSYCMPCDYRHMYYCRCCCWWWFCAVLLSIGPLANVTRINRVCLFSINGVDDGPVCVSECACETVIVCVCVATSAVERHWSSSIPAPAYYHNCCIMFI